MPVLSTPMRALAALNGTSICVVDATVPPPGSAVWKYFYEVAVLIFGAVTCGTGVYLCVVKWQGRAAKSASRNAPIGARSSDAPGASGDNVEMGTLDPPPPPYQAVDNDPLPPYSAIYNDPPPPYEARAAVLGQGQERRGPNESDVVAPGLLDSRVGRQDDTIVEDVTQRDVTAASGGA